MARVRRVEIDAPVKPVRTEIVGVNIPDVAVFGACRLEVGPSRFGERFSAAAIAGHRFREPLEIDHSP